MRKFNNDIYAKLRLDTPVKSPPGGGRVAALSTIILLKSLMTGNMTRINNLEIKYFKN